MKRDLDLVRSILMYVENADGEVDADDMATERWPIETVAYHVRLMAHHRLHCRAGHGRGRPRRAGLH